MNNQNVILQEKIDAALVFLEKKKEFPPLLYLIGIIDTKGFFVIWKYKMTNRVTIQFSWQHFFYINSRSLKACIYLKREFGGSIRIIFKDAKTDSYQWNISGKKLEFFCKKIKPYLYILKDECELILRLRSTYPTNGRARIKSDISDKRDRILIEYNDIHKKTLANR